MAALFAFFAFQITELSADDVKMREMLENISGNWTKENVVCNEMTIIAFSV